MCVCLSLSLYIAAQGPPRLEMRLHHIQPEIQDRTRGDVPPLMRVSQVIEEIHWQRPPETETLRHSSLRKDHEAQHQRHRKHRDTGHHRPQTLVFEILGTKHYRRQRRQDKIDGGKLGHITSEFRKPIVWLQHGRHQPGQKDTVTIPNEIRKGHQRNGDSKIKNRCQRWRKEKNRQITRRDAQDTAHQPDKVHEPTSAVPHGRQAIKGVTKGRRRDRYDVAKDHAPGEKDDEEFRLLWSCKAGDGGVVLCRGGDGREEGLGHDRDFANEKHRTE